MTATRDTIFALASAPGRAGVAVVRVSGPGAYESIRQLTARQVPPERAAVVRTLYDPSSSGRIDEALVLRFAAPRSYTGEDVAEFHVHGGRAVVAALAAALGRLPAMRIAEPGEFTRRAVENGRLDLTQAEAVADIINAETEAQRRQALRQFDGALRDLYESWRSRLIRATAWVEAVIDFPDEEIPAEALAGSRQALRDIAAEMAAHLADNRRGEILRDGFHIAVIGPPNAGKSSLVNALARRDVAIVSEIAGTTRDVLEVRLDLGGYPVIFADTAGLRESEDAIEREGVRRARVRAEMADATLVVLDGSEAIPAALQPEIARADLVVWNKADLAKDQSRPGHWLSAKTAEGLENLVREIALRASQAAGLGDAPALTQARHREALQDASAQIEAALAAPGTATELAAENLRRALRALGRITGRVDLEELLDVVFRDFCIGK